MKSFLVASLFVMLTSGGLLISMPKSDNTEKEPVKISNLWYEGKAEISTFKLEQNRYNDQHEGELVMIFVTEDFNVDKQVKSDRFIPGKTKPVLKNNRIRKFTTGVYDYSIYTSAFTVAKNTDQGSTLKVSMSSQDWCGQSFAQINNKGSKNKISSYSYFEQEGDNLKTLDDVLLLDEVFNLIRINAEGLPLGEIMVSPTLLFSRLKHVEYKNYNAIASSGIYDGPLVDEGPLKFYKIDIPALDYTFETVFINKGTREIIAFKENYPSAFDGVIRETIATRKNIRWMDYWNMNDKSDYSFRSDLKINYQ